MRALAVALVACPLLAAAVAAWWLYGTPRRRPPRDMATYPYSLATAAADREITDEEFCDLISVRITRGEKL